MADQIKAGDSVLHEPTGEQWYVLGVNKLGELCVAGFPHTIANVSDCKLVKRGNGITEDERIAREKIFGTEWE